MYGPKRLARCVFAPVQLANDQVAQFRQRFDALDGKCPPHVTLVFPFVSDTLDSDLTIALQGSVPDAPIHVTLLAPELDGSHVVLRVEQPEPWFDRVHQSLSALAGSRLTKVYRPHVTIGRGLAAAPVAAMETLPSKLRARIDRLVLEEIQEDESSRVLHEAVFG